MVQFKKDLSESCKENCLKKGCFVSDDDYMKAVLKCVQK
jgi:hypothetical protein